MDEWNKISIPLITQSWVILKIRKMEGGYYYSEIASEKGDWEDLVTALWQDHKQFSDRLLDLYSRQKIDSEIQQIAKELEAANMPYPFSKADFSDDWYIGFVVSSNSRIFPDLTVSKN